MGEEAKTDKQKVLKLMIEFEGDEFDAFHLSRIETTEKASIENDSGLDWLLILRFAFPPYEKIHSYKTPELREKRHNQLKDKMKSLNILFV